MGGNSKPKHRRFSIGILIFASIGVFLIGLASYLAYNDFSFYSRCLKTEGVVTSKENYGLDSEVTIQVSFVDEKTGRQVRAYFSSGGVSRYNMGDKVEVLYNPDNPTSSRLGGFWNDDLLKSHNFWIGFIFAWGALFILPAVIFIFRSMGAH